MYSPIFLTKCFLNKLFFFYRKSNHQHFFSPSDMTFQTSTILPFITDSPCISTMSFLSKSHRSSTTYEKDALTLAFILLFSISLAPTTARAYKATVVIGEVSQRDRSRPIYPIHFPRLGDFESTFNPKDDEIPDGYTSTTIVTAKGQKMRCVLPQSKPSQQTASSPERDQFTIERQFDNVDTLLKDYHNKCFLRLEGWWTYEFCFGKHVVQKHIIPKDREPYQDEGEVEFVLGKYDRDLDLARRKDPDLVSTSDTAFTQLFINGSVCDMTGEPRRVLVKFVCRDEAVQLGSSSSSSQGLSVRRDLTILNAVREVESCVYEVEFMNGAICKHPAYQYKMTRVERPIHCSLEHGEGPFEGLNAEYYRRPTLTF